MIYLSMFSPCEKVFAADIDTHVDAYADIHLIFLSIKLINRISLLSLFSELI